MVDTTRRSPPPYRSIPGDGPQANPCARGIPHRHSNKSLRRRASSHHDTRHGMVGSEDVFLGFVVLRVCLRCYQAKRKASRRFHKQLAFIDLNGTGRQVRTVDLWILKGPVRATCHPS